MDIIKQLCKTNKIREANGASQWNLYITKEARALVEAMETKIKQEIKNNPELRKKMCPSLIIETFMRECYQSLTLFLINKRMEEKEEVSK